MEKKPDSGGPIALPAAEFEALLERAAETDVLLALMAGIAIKLKVFGTSPYAFA